MSHKHTINHGHTLNLYGRGDNAVGGNEKVLRSGDSKLSGCGSIANYNGYSSYDLYNDASTPAKITNTENTGGTETRSTNFSVRICKRMSQAVRFHTLTVIFTGLVSVSVDDTV